MKINSIKISRLFFSFYAEIIHSIKIIRRILLFIFEIEGFNKNLMFLKEWFISQSFDLSFYHITINLLNTQWAIKKKFGLWTYLINLRWIVIFTRLAYLFQRQTFLSLFMCTVTHFFVDAKLFGKYIVKT